MAKKQEVVLTPKEQFAYGYIISALAGGLYPNKFHVVREYIQNAFDAIVDWRAATRRARGVIKVRIEKPSIFIYDNGTGMDRHTLNEYRKVGFSKKLVGEAAGFRGIGKLAGLSVAKKLVVVTSPYGVPEKYTLTFDARAMLEEIDKLKEKRQNIPLNSLIQNRTELTSDVENKDEHYTMVELQEIRPDSKVLFDSARLEEYISKNAPVPFDPSFEHREEIEEQITQFVEDYDCVKITMDGQKDIYKPFAGNLKSPKPIVVFGGQNHDKVRALCWYCEHGGKGQIDPTDIGGLVYRYKNFAVGDNYLTRKTIWERSSHLAFYFMGEVYVADARIVPTSQRDDFEQTGARDTFYEEAKVISKQLNRIARTSSGVRRAEEYVKRGAEVVSKIDRDLKDKQPYLRDLSVEKITQLSNVVTNIEKRKKNIADDDKKTKVRATRVVKKANRLLKDFERVNKAEAKDFDIVNRLRFGQEASLVYSTVIRTLKDLFVDRQDELEKIVKTVQRNLQKVFRKK